MNTLIKRIVDLAGPMPDVNRHVHYLKTLTERQLKNRLAALLTDSTEEPEQQIEFWRPMAEPRPGAESNRTDGTNRTNRTRLQYHDTARTILVEGCWRTTGITL